MAALNLVQPLRWIGLCNVAGSIQLANPLPVLALTLELAPTPIDLNFVRPAPVVAFTGAAGVGGSVAINLPVHALQFTGGVYSLTLSRPAPTLSFSAVTVQPASLALLSPARSLTFGAVLPSVAMLDLKQSKRSFSFASLSSTSGVLQITLPKRDLQFGAGVGATASLGFTLPLPRLSFTAVTQITGTLRLKCPLRTVAFSAHVPAVQLATLVVNTITNSTVVYESYPYNSFAEFNGKYLAAGPGGLYQIDAGQLDDVTPIAAHILTGELSFGSEYQKRVTDFYMGLRSVGDITLSIATDENTPVEYTLAPLATTTIKQRRASIGKGLRGKYWQIGIKNNDGGDFDIDTMNITAVPLSRRI